MSDLAYKYKHTLSSLNDLTSAAFDCKYDSPKAKQEMMIAALSEFQLIDFVNALPKIHIAGSKGKGTTAFYTERLLRAHGFRTGLFTSPHLVDVEERIAVNGNNISKSDFVEAYDWTALQYSKLGVRFNRSFLHHLMVMALYMFRKRSIDVAIIEVGLGGRFDYTNCFKKSSVSVITSLALEHTEILGDTIEKIAFEKAGIMKPDCPVITTSTQSEAALKVLRDEASRTHSPLYTVPPLESTVQGINSSLAVAAVNLFEGKDAQAKANPEDIKLLANAQNPGRWQTINLTPSCQVLLDCAHTRESLHNTGEWFSERCSPSDLRVLLFTLTGPRDAQQMIENALMVTCHFDIVLVSQLGEDSQLLKRPKSKACGWEKCLEVWKAQKTVQEVHVLKSEEKFFTQLYAIANNNAISYDSELVDILEPIRQASSVKVLVTGSVYLVGNCLEAIRKISSD